MNNTLRNVLRLLIAAICAIVGAYLFGTNLGALLSYIHPSDSPVSKVQVLIHFGLVLLGGFLLSASGIWVSRGYITRLPLDWNSRHFAGFFKLLYFRQVADRQPIVDEPLDYPQGMDTTIEND